MSEPQDHDANEPQGQVEVMTRFSMTNVPAILDEAVNRVMLAEKFDARALVMLCELPLKALKTQAELRKQGLAPSREFLHAYGLNGMAVLPAASAGGKDKPSAHKSP